jgi:N-acetylmuramoyl-L-alanine amidase CwlA
MAEEPFNKKYIITTRYLTKPSRRRSGLPMTQGVKFIVAHDTGNPGSTASGNVRYYENSRDEMAASAHLFVDDREIIECIPALEAPPEKAWHVLYGAPTDNQLYGFDANDAALAVEYCYGGAINADEAYRKYVWVIAYACHRFRLNPQTAVTGHFFLDPKRKTDPVTGLAQSRRTYEQLLRHVVEEYQACTQAAPQPQRVEVIETAGTVRAAARLNVRKAPSTQTDVVQVVTPGTLMPYNGWTLKGESINGNAKWFRTGNGNFFWSGGTL